MFEDLQVWLLKLSWQEVLGALADIIIVYYVVYRGLLLIRGTKAAQMLLALVSIIFLFFISTDGWLNLPTVHWVLEKFIGSFALILVVIFQDDLRRGLSLFGQSSLLTSAPTTREDNQVIEEIVKACALLSSRRVGGLMAIRRDAELAPFVTAGVELDANVSKDLLFSIFLPTHQNPLHDGAVIIHGGRIVRAGCFLPLTISPRVDKALGTRHRAAIGLSEQTDAAIVVVSEESGIISLIHDEEIVRGLDSTALREGLQRLLVTKADGVEESGGLAGLLRRFDHNVRRRTRRSSSARSSGANPRPVAPPPPPPPPREEP